MTLLLIPLGHQIVQHGWRGMFNGRDTLASGLEGLLLSLAGTFVIAIWKAAVILDIGHRARIAELEAQLKERSRTPAEEYHYDRAKTALGELGKDEHDMLRHLNIHGRIAFRASGPPPLPDGMTSPEAVAALDRCVTFELVTREHDLTNTGGIYPAINVFYQISPAMKGPLDELLYR